MSCNFIDGNTYVTGLIGSEVTQSFSPFIHNTISKYLNLNCVYTAFNINQNLEVAINGASALGIRGFNITKPFKKEVIKYLKKVDEHAQILGAVNTVKLVDNGYHGYNTDYYGFYKTIIDNNINLKNKKVLVIGAGGSSLSICKVVEKMDVKTLHLCNRTKENGLKILNKIKVIDKNFFHLDDIKGYYDLVVQCTSLGYGKLENEVPINYKKVDCKYYIDIIYKPFKTKLYLQFEKKGAICLNGFHMLLYQAFKSYEIINDIKLDNDICNVLNRDIKEYYLNCQKK